MTAVTRPTDQGLLTNQELIRNTLVMRQAWLRRLLDPRRDIDQECGHPFEISVDDYKQMYKRGDVSARVVSIYPDECWSTDPEVYESEDETETPFETAWNELCRTIPIYSFLHRADVLSGIGRYGGLLLGFDDGLELRLPVTGGEANGGTPTRKLLYVRPFDEALLNVVRLETNISNPRFGLPLQYEITFDTSVVGAVENAQMQVDWTRVLHIVDNRMDSEVYGNPRMQRVFNRLLDLAKIAGGSGEMFWKGGFPGLSLETLTTPDASGLEIDKEATKEQMAAYMNGLQRYIATVGMTVKSLNVEVADPQSHIEQQLRLIAAALAIPWRVLIGSEAAQLASVQDTRAWNRRLARRQTEYVSPFILRPFIKRLIDFGVLPAPAKDYHIEWQDLNTLGDEEKANIAKARTDAITKYVQAGADVLIPPFQFFTLVLGYTDAEAHTMIQAADAQVSHIDVTTSTLAPAMVKASAPTSRAGGA